MNNPPSRVRAGRPSEVLYRWKVSLMGQAYTFSQMPGFGAWWQAQQPFVSEYYIPPKPPFARKVRFHIPFCCSTISPLTLPIFFYLYDRFIHSQLLPAIFSTFGRTRYCDLADFHFYFTPQPEP